MDTKTYREKLGQISFMFSGTLLASALIASTAWAGVVTSTANGGPGSLRQEIIDANADAVPTLITFHPGVFPATISLTSRLPALTDPGDTIDGTGLGVVVDGASVPNIAGSTAFGIRVRASNVTIRGLTITNFLDDGISVTPLASGTSSPVTGVMIRGNTLSNNLDGLSVSGRAGPDNSVQAFIVQNTFLQNNDDGIQAVGSSGNFGDGGNVVSLVIDRNTIEGSRGVGSGGTTSGDAIRVHGAAGAGANNSVIARITKNYAHDNVDDGIAVAGAGGGAASNNTLHALISGNIVMDNGDVTSLNGNGIIVRGGNRSDPVALGNGNMVSFIASGNRALNNKDTGIIISGGEGSNHRVRGMALGNRTTGNGFDGLRVTGGQGTGNMVSDIRVIANRGLDNARDGLNINGGRGGNSMVTDAIVQANRQERNGRHGILVALGSGIGNAISVSSLTFNHARGNTQDGILVGAGVLGTGTTSIAVNRADRNGRNGFDVGAVGYILSRNKANYNVLNGITAIGNMDGGGNIAIGNTACNTPGCF